MPNANKYLIMYTPRNREVRNIFFNIFDTLMTCSDNERCSKSKVQRKFTKQKQSEHGPLFKKNIEVGFNLIESESSLIMYIWGVKRWEEFIQIFFLNSKRTINCPKQIKLFLNCLWKCCNIDISIVQLNLKQEMLCVALCASVISLSMVQI